MITHIELSTARMYAKMENPTPFQKREIVKFFYKLGTGYIRNFNEDQIGFDKVYQIALTHFKKQCNDYQHPYIEKYCINNDLDIKEIHSDKKGIVISQHRRNIITYLREKEKLSFRKIGELLHKDHSNCWESYQKGKTGLSKEQRRLLNKKGITNFLSS